MSLFGTNCGNCRFFTGRKVPLDDLNDQGGFKGADNERAEDGDLITLPGNHRPIHGRLCSHPKIIQRVNDRMCCAYWDARGVIREWKS